VSIDWLTFSAVDGNGHTSSSPAPASCINCTGPVSVSGTYALPGPGTYSLYMAFTVSGVPQRFRTERALWRGPDQPLNVICGGSDGANQQISCPVPEGMVAVPAPAAESMVPDLEADH
jgi:hypothetical protein